MFNNLSSLVQKAQQLIDPNLVLSSPTDRKPTRASLFRQQFRLPESQSPLHEILAELTLAQHRRLRGNSDAATAADRERERDRGDRYSGRLLLSEQYLCFSTQG